MINNIIKEEIEEEELTSEHNENINDDKFNNNIDIMKDKKISSEMEGSMLSVTNLNSENTLSEDSDDILPIIYSKYKRQIEPTKKKALITSSNINLYEKDDEKRTILHRACLQIKLGIIKDLAPKLTKAYVNQLDKYGNTPLILACKYSSINEFKEKEIKEEREEREQILEILIKHGANVHCIEPINGWTALHWCCFNGDLSSAKLLMNYGANFFLPSKYGFFTIDLAGKRLFYELVSYLIKRTANYLQKIGEYELLDIENLISENINITNNNNLYSNVDIDKNDGITIGKKTLNLGKIKTFNQKKPKEEKSFSRRSISGNIKKLKLGILTEMSDLPKINQTIYLRLFTEHCLYWACYFNYNEKIINMFLSLYNARSGFPLFCLDNQTSLHAACIQGSLIPFQLVYKTYEIKRSRKLTDKTGKKIPVSVVQNDDNNNNIRRIAYPKEFKEFKKQFLSSAHFNSLNKQFRNYLENNFFELVYPKTLIETLPLNKIFDNKRNTPVTLASKYNKQKFIEKLKEMNLVQNIYDELRPENNYGFSGYYYLKNVEFRRKFVKEAGSNIYIIPPVVLELNKNAKTKSSINLIMKIAKNEGLIVSLMEHIRYSKVYLLIDISEELFYELAEKEKIEMRLLDKNLFLKFENNKKFIDSVEPVLSRQFQYIIVKCLSNCLDTEMLKDQKILNQMFLTHMPHITNKIYSSIIIKPFYALNPICYFFDYFLEDKNCTYSYIKLLYNYFGESISMYYAFYAFLTIMYSPLAIASIVYLILYKSDLFTGQDIYPSFFIIFIFWNIFISIKWARKCNEIQQKWGQKVSSDYQIIRPEFKGDEYYSDLDAPLEKHVSKYDSFISFFATLPLIILLLGADVAVYYFTTKWEDLEKENENFWFRYVPSIVRSLVLVVIAKIYDIIAVYSTYLENRKQEDIYELIMSLKIFIFRLISDFTAVIYSAIVTRDIVRLKTLLYTDIFIKYLSEIGIRYFYPILWNYFFKKIYFKRVNKKTKQYNMDNIELGKVINPNMNYDIKADRSDDRNNHIIETMNGNELKLKENQHEINTERDNKRIKSENEYLSGKKNLPTLKEIITSNEKYKRVSVISPYISNESENKSQPKIFNINPDFIEIQRIFNQKSPVYYDYANILIMHSYISLFAIIIPFAPIVCFFFSIISQNARLYIDIFHLKRPTPLSCKNIKTWNKILELNIIIMTFTNIFLYYFYGTDNFFIGKKTANVIEISLFSGEKSFFGLICAEHFFIFIHFIIKKMISDMPNWVVKEKENLLGYYQILSLDKQKKANLEISLKIEKSKNLIKELEKEKMIQNDKINLFQKNFDFMNKEMLFKQKKIDEYNEAFDEIKKNIKNPKISDIENKSQNSLLKNDVYNKKKIKKLLDKKIEKYHQDLTEESDDMTFTNSVSLEKNENKNIFLSTRKVKKNINIKLDKAIEKAIKELSLLENNINLLSDEKEESNVDTTEVYFILIIKRVFDSIEKIIINQKLEFYLKNNISGLVICSSCAKNSGTLECKDCEEILCTKCKEVHLKNNLWEKHNIKPLSLPLKNNIDTKNILNDNTENTIPYIKAEYFSFPESTFQNLGYENLLKIFDIFYKYYITYNGIDLNNNVSLKEFLQYRLEYFTKIEGVPEQAFLTELENIINNNEFNWTEIYYINRICFKCFKYYGAKTTIDKVFDPLKKLEIGEFEEKLKILLNMLDLYDNKIVFKSEMEKFLAVSMYQNYSEDLSAEKIIEELFPEDAKFQEYSALYSCIMYKKSILAVFKHLLQCYDENDISDDL